MYWRCHVLRQCRRRGSWRGVGGATLGSWGRALGEREFAGVVVVGRVGGVVRALLDPDVIDIAVAVFPAGAPSQGPIFGATRGTGTGTTGAANATRSLRARIRYAPPTRRGRV